MESVSDRVKQLEGVVRVNGQNTESVRSVLIQLQGRVNHQSINQNGQLSLCQIRKGGRGGIPYWTVDI